MIELKRAAKYLIGVRPRWPQLVIGVLMFFAIFGDFIANEKPVFCQVNGRSYFPIFKAGFVELGWATWGDDLSGGQWRTMEYDRVIYTLIPYSPSGIDSRNGNFRSPFGAQDVPSWRFRHWLGTDALGRDVTAGLIRGCRIALVVGVLSMLIAVLIGVPLGAIAGYFGDRRRKKPIPVIVLWGVAILIALWCATRAAVFWAIYGEQVWAMICALTGLALIGIVYLIDRFGSPSFPSKWNVGVPWDFTILRGVEVVRSMPAFFLLFALLAVIADPSIAYVVVLIGFLRSPTVIRYVRAEAMKLRDMGFVDTARVIGLGDSRIIRRHIIPNSMGPVMITVAFGIGGAVLLESGLSFLGIGLSIDQMSWGRMLNEARSNFSAWWLAALPGAAIFLTVAAFNRLGEDMTDWFERAD